MINTKNSEEISDFSQENQQDNQDSQQVKNYSEDSSQNDNQEVNQNPNSNYTNSGDSNNSNSSDSSNSSSDSSQEEDSTQTQATVKHLQIKIMELHGQLEILEAKNLNWKQKTEILLEKHQTEIKTINNQHQLDLEATQKKVKKSIVSEIVDFLNTLNISFTFVPNSSQEHKEERIGKFINTLKGSFDKLIKDLEKQNIFIILPEVGQEFDPQTMSPLQSSDQEDTKVKNVVSLGIRLDNQVIKPAVVIL